MYNLVIATKESVLRLTIKGSSMKEALRTVSGVKTIFDYGSIRLSKKTGHRYAISPSDVSHSDLLNAIEKTFFCNLKG